jgi:uncharacterized membrane protein YeaQ/YmgE (transglycosylase-associated protein family)
MTFFAFLSWCLIGLIAGSLAKLIMPGRDPGGVIVTILLGIAGAFLGGWIGAIFSIDAAASPVKHTLFVSIITGTVGAVILLIAYRMVMRRRM